MTALALATQIPSQIDTLEKLAAWVSLTLANINSAQTAIEGQGYTERVSQANIYYIQADAKYRIITRQSIVMSANYLAGGTKLWQHAQELSTTAIPTLFSSN